MDVTEEDLQQVFNICDTDGDGIITREELENIFKSIGMFKTIPLKYLK